MGSVRYYREDGNVLCPACYWAQVPPSAPSASGDQWAQLASDCGVTPACDTREEFVALMKKVVERASAPAASPEAIKRAIITYHAAIADAYDNQDDDAPPMGQELREYVGMRAVLRVAASPEMMEVDVELAAAAIHALGGAVLPWEQVSASRNEEIFRDHVRMCRSHARAALTAALKGKKV